MKKAIKLLLATLTVLTLIYSAVVAYASVNETQLANSNLYPDGVTLAATIYEGIPENYSTPEELGITYINDFGKPNTATVIEFVVSYENHTALASHRPFSYTKVVSGRSLPSI